MNIMAALTMCDKTAKIPSNNAVPCGALFRVELEDCELATQVSRALSSYFSLDVLRNVLRVSVLHRYLALLTCIPSQYCICPLLLALCHVSRHTAIEPSSKSYQLQELPVAYHHSVVLALSK